ncbi:MAG: class II aldolase/adducin family protein [Rhodobacterales bacterium]|nr:class II aldolase/adducin family protein [Rhodobacterales bacterium]
MDELETKLREQIVDVMAAMDVRGLNRGTSGNVSARFGDDVLITPTGIPPSALKPEHIVRMDAEGRYDPAGMKPSSEWLMHLKLLQLRPDANAVVHCHSRFATTLACANKPIPALHYMVAVSGGPSVPVAPYATFGSSDLAESVCEALAGQYAALMANHGQIVVAPGLRQALLIAEEVEEQAAVYWGTLAIGGATLLGDDEMTRISERFKSYGQKKK